MRYPKDAQISELLPDNHPALSLHRTNLAQAAFAQKDSLQLEPLTHMAQRVRIPRTVYLLDPKEHRDVLTAVTDPGEGVYRRRSGLMLLESTPRRTDLYANFDHYPPNRNPDLPARLLAADIFAACVLDLATVTKADDFPNELKIALGAVRPRVDASILNRLYAQRKSLGKRYQAELDKANAEINRQKTELDARPFPQAFYARGGRVGVLPEGAQEPVSLGKNVGVDFDYALAEALALAVAQATSLTPKHFLDILPKRQAHPVIQELLIKSGYNLVESSATARALEGYLSGELIQLLLKSSLTPTQYLKFAI